ncbi:MAG: hypothetical protein A2386_03240 [Elusimicrobia bacterium RIFOXYB1_FULL_48_9]|nr:MAG: hypothetical protein A2386_03240 [Elusimicrobia bacterium RIFOXYB1_FULL_48_9]
MFVVLLILAALFTISSWALSAQSAPFLFIAFIVLEFYLAFSRPKTALKLLFFILPWFNILSNTVFRYRAIPAVLLFLSGWIAGYLAGRWFKKEPFVLPDRSYLFIAFLSVIFLSSAYSFAKYIAFLPDFNATVATLYLGETVKLKNIFGWIMLGAIQWSAGPLFFLTIYDFINRKSEFISALKWIAPGFVVSIAIGIYQNYFNYGFGLPPEFVNAFGRISAGCFDPNALGYFLLLLVPVLAYLALVYDSPVKFALWTEVAAGIFMIFLSGNRSVAGSVLAVSALAILFIFFRKDIRKKYLMPAILSLLLLAGLFFAPLSATKRIKEMVYNRFAESGTWSEFLKPDIFGERIPYWELSLKVIKDNIFLGTGVGRYLVVTPDYLRASHPLFNNNENACNYYLQLLSETGIFMTLVFFLLLVFVLNRIRLSLAPLRNMALQDFLIAASLIFMLLALNLGPHLINFEVSVIFWTSIALLWTKPGHSKGSL